MTKFSAAQQSQLAQIGAFLRENRKKQEKSLEDIAIRTYIRPQLLNGIEKGDPDVLPEPIFVQGFIRRYAESLGLKGVELSKQFTVTSIPSTPRPARTAEPESNSTRLLTREVSTTSPIPASTVSTPVVPEVPISEPISEPTPEPTPEPVLEPTVADAPPMFTPNGIEHNSEPHSEISSEPAAEDFASKVAAFDQENLEAADAPLGAAVEQKPLEQSVEALDFEPSPDVPVTAEAPAIPEEAPAAAEAPTVPETPTVPEMPVITPTFDDDLPAEFTMPPSDPVAMPTPPPPVYSPEPVGVEYGSQGPNLKPFAIGAVVAAAIVAGLILLVNMLGGGDRTPDVVTDNDTEQIDPITPAEDTLPPVPEQPAATEPPASTQPVYVEAEATAETYVSVNVDGVNVFEGTMQPGDTILWEGQSEIDVYSGNAGGLTLSANGGEAEPLGASGQLGQEIFTAP